MAGARGIKAGRAFVEVGVDNQVAKGLAKVKRQLRAFGASIKSAGRELAGFAAVSAAPIAAALKIFSGFDDQMRLVAAVSGATGDAFAELTEEAKRLGRTTSFTASQVASAMVEMARAGFNPKQINAITESMLALSRATGTDLTESARIAGSALRGFRLDAGQINRVVDVLGVTANRSAQTLIDLFEAIKFVAPIAVEAGDSIEDTAAAIGILANSGIRGTRAGTALARAYKNLANPAFSSQLKALGVEIDANTLKISDALEQIERGVAGLGRVERLGVFESLFGRGQVAALALASSTDAFKEFRDELRNVDGRVLKLAEDMDRGLGGTFRRILSAAEGVAIALGSELGPAFQSIEKSITGTLAALTEWISRNRNVIVNTTLMVAAAGTLGVAMIGLGSAIQIVSFAFGGLVVAMNAMAAVKAAVVVFASFMALLAAPGSILAGGLVAAGILAAAVAIGALAFAMRRASIVTADVSDEMTKLAGKSREVANEHRTAATRLAELSKWHRLSNRQMSEAIDLNSMLSKAYGDVGVAFDTTTKTIDASTEAFKRLGSAIDAMLQRPVEEALEEQKRNFRELSEEITNIAGGASFIPFVSDERIKFNPFTSEDDRIAELQALERRREAVADKIFRMQDELARLRGPEEPGMADPEASAAIDAEADASIRAQRRVVMLRLKMIEDEEARERALISARYEHEIEDAGRNEAEIASLREAQALELEQSQRGFTNRRRRFAIDIEHELALLKTGLIKDVYRRELALIKENHRHAIALAAGPGVATTAADEMRAIERQLAEAKELERLTHARQSITEANARRVESIEELRLRTQHEGIELEEKMLELQEQRAVAAAKAAGLQLDLIKKEFDLRRRLLHAGPETSSRISSLGTFNPAGLRGLGGTSATDRIASNTASMKQQLISLNRKASQGQLVFAGNP